MTTVDLGPFTYNSDTGGLYPSQGLELFVSKTQLGAKGYDPVSTVCAGILSASASLGVASLGVDQVDALNPSSTSIGKVARSMAIVSTAADIGSKSCDVPGFTARDFLTTTANLLGTTAAAAVVVLAAPEALVGGIAIGSYAVLASAFTYFLGQAAESIATDMLDSVRFQGEYGAEYIHNSMQDRALSEPEVAMMSAAISNHDTASAAKHAMNVAGVYPDRILRVAAGYEGTGVNGSFIPSTYNAGTGYVGDHPGPTQDVIGNTGNSDHDPVRPPTVSVNTSASNGEGAVNNGHGPTQAPSGPAGAPISVIKPKPTPPKNDYNPPGNEKDNGRRPILLDLNGNGVQITDLTKSTQFIDSGNDGLKHRTAWAAAGDGVLFYDADNDNTISQTREYVFTEWDPTAKSDMQALRARFDSNNDGKLTAADAAFAQVKVIVTQADGSQVAQSLRNRHLPLQGRWRPAQQQLRPPSPAMR